VTTAFLGAKQEGLAIVNSLNKLIVSCKEAVRIPIFLLLLFLNWIVIFYSNILINSSEATGPIGTKLWWNGPWMATFQNCVR
jgi:hypothetical protein